MPQRVPARIELKPAQQQALAALREGELIELSRGAYQELTGMSRSQAAYDLADLVETGLLQRVGGGRSTRYRLPQEGQVPAHRRWTPERIRAGLAKLCEGRTTWPSAQEFKSAGRGDLYVAASRYGGIAHWAAELGLPKASDAARTKTPRRLSWAVAAVVAVQPWLGAPKKPAVAQGASVTEIVGKASPHRVATRPKSTKRRAAASSTRHGTSTQKAAVVTSSAELASRTVSSPQASGVLAAEKTRRAPAAGPTPIEAPISSSSVPPPLPSP